MDENSCENCGVMANGKANCAICTIVQYLEAIGPDWLPDSAYDQPENVICPFWRPIPLGDR